MSQQEASLAQMREESEQHKAGLGAEAADALRKLEAEREAWASEKQTLQDAEAAAHAKLSEHAASTAAALDAAGKRESELAEQAKQIATQHEEAGAAALSKVDAALQKEQVARAEAEQRRRLYRQSSPLRERKQPVWKQGVRNIEVS